MPTPTTERTSHRSRYTREYNTDVPGVIRANVGAGPLHYLKNGLWVPSSDYSISGSANTTISGIADECGLSVTGKTITIRTPTGTTTLVFEGIYGDYLGGTPELLWAAPNNLKPARMSITANSIEYDLGNRAKFVIEASPERVAMKLIILSNPMTGLPVTCDRIWLQFAKTGVTQPWETVWARDADGSARHTLFQEDATTLKKGLSNLRGFTSSTIYPITVDPTSYARRSQSWMMWRHATNYPYQGNWSETFYGATLSYLFSCIARCEFLNDKGGEGWDVYHYRPVLVFDLFRYIGTITNTGFKFTTLSQPTNLNTQMNQCSWHEIQDPVPSDSTWSQWEPSSLRNLGNVGDTNIPLPDTNQTQYTWNPTALNTGVAAKAGKLFTFYVKTGPTMTSPPSDYTYDLNASIFYSYLSFDHSGDLKRIPHQQLKGT